jgi:thiol:disulfide interchange protein DsbD
MSFASTTPGVRLGTPAFPSGETHEDDYFGRQIVFRNRIVVPIPVELAGNSHEFDLQLKLQGCADAGLCYPPTTWTTHVVAKPARDAAATVAPPAPNSGGVNLSSLVGTAATGDDGRFLKPDRAFVLAADSAQPDRVQLDWEIADGYYLYRDRVTVRSLSPDVELGAPRLPDGESHQDDYFGAQTIYRGLLAIDVPVSRAASVRELPLEIGYQGCADAGLCYPPIKKQITVILAPLGQAVAATTNTATPPAGTADTQRSEQDTLADRIRNGGLFGMLAFFFGAGLLLSLTPCVLPMVPILSGIIVGAGRDRPISRGRAFALSLAYVLGMALTYTIAGAAFAAAGQQAQAFFQKPWMIATFAGLFVVLALGMFGLFTIQMPAALQAKVSDASNRQSQGTLLGTAVMGALSSLIVTACVAPPLVAALAVIGQSGNIVRGGAALFAMSLGMGMPLLVVGASAGQLLPKAGAWMDIVKAVFGVMLLGVAVWMLSRILPGPVTLALWAALAFVTGYCLMTIGGREIRNGSDAVRRGVGALAAVYGILLLIGALAGRSDPLQPLAGLGVSGAGSSPEAAELTPFKRIKTVADLEREVAAATAAGKPAMLDFYADWCVSCKEMERYTFPDPGVRAELDRAVLLQADVTANDAEDQALLKQLGILGPPSIVFFDASGRERPELRVVGFKPAAEFRTHLARAFGGSSP